MPVKRFLPALAVVLIGLALCSPPPRALATATVTQSLYITSTGPSPVLDFSGQLQCEVQINQPFGTFQATPQYSTDGVNWDTAVGIASGTVGTTGVFIGTVPPGPGYQHFRLFFNKFAAVYMSGQLACGDSLPPTSGGTNTNCVTTTVTACSQVIQASAYGVAVANTDNGPDLSAAITAACGLGGGIIQLPWGRLEIQTPVVLACSGIVIEGNGRGYGGGSGHFPTAIPPATTLYCGTSLSGSPILSLFPVSVEQTANAVEDLGFDGNADTCAVGLYATAQQQPRFEHLSFKGFSGIAFHLQGQSVGGLGINQGSVIHPYINMIQISMQNVGDGTGMVLDASPFPSSPPNDMGDVFSGYGGNIACITYHPNCVVIGRSDHLEVDDIQVNFTNGAPTPTPVGLGTPSPSPFPGMAVTCGAEGDRFAANLLVQIQQAVQYQGASWGATCPPPWNPPHGTYIQQQTYSNGAQGPSNDGNSNLSQQDDHGDYYLSAAPGVGFPLYICFGFQAFNGSSCQTGAPLMMGDTAGNLFIGTRGTVGGQCSRIEFGPSGSNNGTVPANWTSMIGCSGDNGSLGDGALIFPGNGSFYGSAEAKTVGPVYASSNTAVVSALAPMYNNDGTAFGVGTNHGAKVTCTFSASTSCALGANYWTGAAIFNSSTSVVGCSFASNAADGITYTFHQTGTQTGTVIASASTSDTVTGMCWGF